MFGLFAKHEKTISILTIGNSFANNAIRFLADMAGLREMRGAIRMPSSLKYND